MMGAQDKLMFAKEMVSMLSKNNITGPLVEGLKSV